MIDITKPKITVLTNIYNEEYLLPYWLDYHKDIFDHGIVIDYRSNDASVEIVKSICPNWEIRTTVNEAFEASKIDEEFMNIEKTLDGYKIVLNTTEFLTQSTKEKLRDILENKKDVCLELTCYAVYSNKKDFYPRTLNDMFQNIEYVNDKIRLKRYLHSYENGNYTIGRHSTYLNSTPIDKISIAWLGNYPYNDRTLERKFQIKKNIPHCDIQNGRGFHHFWNEEQILEQIFIGISSGVNVNNSPHFSNVIKNIKKRYIVTGGAGFIGSHLTDKLIEQGHEVIILDNLLFGKMENVNKNATFINCDITDINNITIDDRIDGIFHLAAIARTPCTIEDPILCYKTNVLGTLNILEIARKKGIKKVIMTSSNVIYASWTPYKSSKEALESLGRVYNELYGIDIICLRNSNVYGTRQSLEGYSPNVFASLQKCKNDNGYIEITGDGEQSRDFTHVDDIVSGHIKAMNSDVKFAILDLCTGVNHSLNDVAKYFNCPIKYIDERKGDIKHIFQKPESALDILGWKASIPLDEGIRKIYG